jgi:hypothetical protein
MGLAAGNDMNLISRYSSFEDFKKSQHKAYYSSTENSPGSRYGSRRGFLSNQIKNYNSHSTAAQSYGTSP